MSGHDPLTEAVAGALNDRFNGTPGTIRIISEYLDPARGDSLMDEIYDTLDRLEARISQRESARNWAWEEVSS